MRKRNVITNFMHLPVLVLIEICRFIIVSMTNNPNFTTPDPALDDFEDLVDDLENKHTLALSGARQAQENMVAAHTLVLDAATLLALYVKKKAKGNLVILTSSGFPLTKIPGAPQRKGFRVKQGENSGEVWIVCSAYPKAKAYVWEIYVGANPPIDESLWKFVKATTQTKTGIGNLSKANTVWFRYCAVTKEGMMQWSHAIDFVVG